MFLPLSDGTVSVSLLCGKPRVTPSKRISTPRSELNGAVIDSRLALSSVRSLSAAGVALERLWFLGDSECILACLEKANCAFGEYFGNRVGEILDNQAQVEKLCPVGRNGEWWHVSSHYNAADQATRSDSCPLDVNHKSSWQLGPEYLKDDPSNWPVSRDFAARKEGCIPQSELLKLFRGLIQTTNASIPTGIDQLIDPWSTNYWSKLLRVTQNLLHWYNKVHVPDFTNANTLQHAMRLWYLSVMPETNTALEKGRLKDLNVRDENGIKVVQGRAPSGMRHFFGQDRLPVIMGSTRVAYLVMLDAHNRDHCDKDITITN